LAPGAYSFSWTVSMEKRRIWIVAPDAYQNAPLMPYCKVATNIAISYVYDIQLHGHSTPYSVDQSQSLKARSTPTTMSK